MPSARRRIAAVALAVAAALGASPPAPAACRLEFYGTYSLGTRHGATLGGRARELRDLGGNFIVATGNSVRALDDLPPGMLAAPGCTLMPPDQWKDAQGRWSTAAAGARLADIAARFDHHPRVWGVCLAHEVNEFADHGRRVWMYALAKTFFHAKKVFFYYARTPPDYGEHGEVESDVFFVALPPYSAHGDYDRTGLVTRLDLALAAIDRTPGIPLWAQTSINADQAYVHGPETMIRTWGADGERMAEHVATLLSRTSPRGTGISGFFWRSFGRFDWDLGYPAFTAHRAQLRDIARRWSCGEDVARVGKERRGAP